MVSGVIFRVEYLILARKTKMLGKLVFLGVCVAVLGLRWERQRLGMVDMPILDRFEIG